jgi:hypothetical protein
MTTRLLEDEKLLYDEERVDFAVYKSLPTLHAAGTVPGLHTIKLMITDRRVIIQGAILGGVQITEFDLWYPGRCPTHDCDVLEAASSGTSQPGGEYLRLIARAREHGPLRSDAVEMYLYLNDAKRLAHMLNEVSRPQPAEWR